MKYVYMFHEGNKDMRNLLGGKGANLAEMTNIGLPVPKGFTISTDACNLYYNNKEKYENDVIKDFLVSIKKLEEETGKTMGSKENPLLVSVRSGARASMPGMMDTVLNLGMNDEVCATIAKKTKNPRFAYDCYRRFISMFGDVVMELPEGTFERFLDKFKAKKGITLDSELSAIDLKELVSEYKKIFKEEAKVDFPADPEVQLTLAVEAVFKSWKNDRADVYRRLNNIPVEWGTAVNVQEMVYGNMGTTSGTGVAFTRDPSTGENKLYGEFLINAQGEDVVAGIRTPESIEKLKEIMPNVYEEFYNYSKKLEEYYKDMQDMEFTIENGKLYMLQTRNGKRTGASAVKSAVDMVDEGLITKEEAIMKVEPNLLDQLLHPMFNKDKLNEAKTVASGLAASPGAATGKICFSAEEAIKRSANNEKLILVRLETSPEDIEGMNVVNGILTVRGGMTSHAAVVARGMGTSCVCGCSEITVDEINKKLTIKDKTYSSNDYISIDGSTGNVYIGEIETEEANISGDFETFMSWADEIRTLKVRTNADTKAESEIALKLGAEGIGLCRTEHMFFEESRIFAFRKMILANTLDEREKALEEIIPYQRKDFEELLGTMHPYSVVIRYLDPPLHEFLPKTDAEIIELANELNISRKEINERIEELKEFNPMLGHRGCRLAITYPEIAKMQTRAIIEASINLSKTGKNVEPEIMIPLVGELKELEFVKNIVDEEANKVMKKNNSKIKYTVGTMIEIPRACLTSREIAKVADFYSFGTNDLTQMTYGLSRDDSSKFLPIYYKENILSSDPFVSIDVKGVGKLVEIGVREGRKVKEKLKIGICGEHGGESNSVLLFDKLGLDYVSCSPYRVPIARLAAARAHLINKKN